VVGGGGWGGGGVWGGGGWVFLSCSVVPVHGPLWLLWALNHDIWLLGLFSAFFQGILSFPRVCGGGGP